MISRKYSVSFLRYFAIRQFRLLFSGKHNTDLRTKLATPLELLPDKWEVGLIQISYRRGFKKGFLHNTIRLDSEEIIFRAKHYESLKYHKYTPNLGTV